MTLYNDSGQNITGIKELSKPEYANSNGDPDWKKILIDAYDRGFYTKAQYPGGGYTK